MKWTNDINRCRVVTQLVLLFENMIENSIYISEYITDLLTDA